MSKQEQRSRAAALLGASRSEKKLAAARTNARKGGRPLSLFGWGRKHRTERYRILSPVFGNAEEITGAELMRLCTTAPEYNRRVVQINENRRIPEDFDGYRQTEDGLFTADGTEQLLKRIESEEK